MGWERPDLDFVHIDDIAGGPATAVHLVTFDSVHVRWLRAVTASHGLAIDGDNEIGDVHRSVALAQNVGARL